MPKIGHRNGCHLGCRYTIVGDRRTELPLVFNRFGERGARCFYFHCGRMSTTIVERSQAKMVRERCLVQKHYFIKCNAICHKRSTIYQTNGRNVMLNYHTIPLWLEEITFLKIFCLHVTLDDIYVVNLRGGGGWYGYFSGDL